MFVFLLHLRQKPPPETVLIVSLIVENINKNLWSLKSVVLHKRAELLAFIYNPQPYSAEFNLLWRSLIDSVF